MNTDILLRTEGLSGGYWNHRVIHDVSFQIHQGSFLGILGPNGSGKSTLLRLLSRVLAPEKGVVMLEGGNIARMKPKEFSRRVACVPQDTPVNFSFTAQEIVLMGRIPHLGRLQIETKNDRILATRALALTDALTLKDKRIDELSAGERQRIFIARALAQEPLMLFLDEPTSHLDISHQIQMMDLLKKLNKEKKLTILIVLHDLNLASEYCDRIILLDKGRIFKEGTPMEVLTYQNIETVYKTIVVVHKNPLTSKPYILLVSGVK